MEDKRDEFCFLEKRPEKGAEISIEYSNNGEVKEVEGRFDKLQSFDVGLKKCHCIDFHPQGRF